MTCIFVAFGLLIIGVSLILWASAVTESRSRFESAYRTVAASLRGRATGGHFLSYPQISFAYGAVKGHVSIVKHQRVWVTQVRFQPIELPFSFEVAPHSRPFSEQGSGWHSLTFEDQELDRKYRVRSTKVEQARKSLNACHRQLRILASAAGPHALSIIGRGRLVTIRVEDRIYDWRVLLELVKFGCEFFDQLLLGADDSIQFVEEVEATLLVDVVCPICGDPIESELVYCPGCKTPHHRECWEYNTRCATFACGRTDYLWPQVAMPIRANDGASSSSAAASSVPDPD